MSCQRFLYKNAVETKLMYDAPNAWSSWVNISPKTVFKSFNSKLS